MLGFLARMIGGKKAAPPPDKPADGEVTGKQVKPGPVFGVGAAAAGGLPHPLDRTIETWRKMRRHPTLRLARAIATGPIRAAEYAVEADDNVPEDRKDFVNETMDPLWRDLMRNMIFAFDYGWQAFEKVYEADGQRQVLVKLKMLLADITYVLLNKESGEFMGVSNGKKLIGWGFNAGCGIVLPPEKVFWYTHAREGDYWYGESVMESAREDFNWWNQTAAKAKKYYTNVAGAVPMLEYPEGESRNSTGSTTDNYRLAIQVIQNLQNAIGVALPGIQSAYLDAVAKQGMDPSKLSAWKVNMLESRARHGPEFEAGLAAREKAMVRAWLLPERAITEGEHGTKAEAETQAKTAMVTLDTILQDILDAINRWIVNPLLVLNYGEEAKGTVRLVVEKQDPRKAELLRQIVLGIFGAPINADLFEDTFNVKTTFELLDLPLAEDFDKAMEERKAEPKLLGTQPPQLAAAQAANLSFTPVTKEVHQTAGSSEDHLVGILEGASRTSNSASFDVITGTAEKPTNLIEVKTLVGAKNDKLTVHPESLVRKREYAAKHPKAKVHTVAYDKRTGTMYYHTGVGSFRLSTMTKVTAAELTKLIQPPPGEPAEPKKEK
jgi:hypothetical protein